MKRGYASGAMDDLLTAVALQAISETFTSETCCGSPHDEVDSVMCDDTDVGSTASSQDTTNDLSDGEKDQPTQLFDPLPSGSTDWLRTWFLSPQRLGQQVGKERKRAAAEAPHTPMMSTPPASFVSPICGSAAVAALDVAGTQCTSDGAVPRSGSDALADDGDDDEIDLDATEGKDFHETRSIVIISDDSSGEQDDEHPRSSASRGSHVDVCVQCGKYGELVVCDTCPRSFHAQCFATAAEALGSATSWECGMCEHPFEREAYEPGGACWNEEMDDMSGSEESSDSEADADSMGNLADIIDDTELKDEDMRFASKLFRIEPAGGPVSGVKRKRTDDASVNYTAQLKQALRDVVSRTEPAFVALNKEIEDAMTADPEQYSVTKLPLQRRQAMIVDNETSVQLDDIEACVQVLMSLHAPLKARISAAKSIAACHGCCCDAGKLNELWIQIFPKANSTLLTNQLPLVTEHVQEVAKTVLAGGALSTKPPRRVTLEPVQSSSKQTELTFFTKGAGAGAIEVDDCTSDPCSPPRHPISVHASSIRPVSISTSHIEPEVSNNSAQLADSARDTLPQESAFSANEAPARSEHAPTDKLTPATSDTPSVIHKSSSDALRSLLDACVAYNDAASVADTLGDVATSAFLRNRVARLRQAETNIRSFASAELQRMMNE